MIKMREARIKDLDIIVELWKEYIKEHREIINEKNPKFKELFVLKSNASDIYKGLVKQNIENGNGVIKVSDERALNEMNNGFYGDMENYQYLYYQKFIKSKWEYKIYGIGNDVYFYKQLPILVNPNKTESRRKIEEIPELKEYCYKSMEVMDLKLTSLDFMKSKDQFFLTDINCTPNFNYIKDGHKIVANYLLKQAKQ